ncbi:MAG: glycosyltransferase family 39 protein [bacterium]|nr:glycosyltransferase family 39 protein [bacterium]
MFGSRRRRQPRGAAAERALQRRRWLWIGLVTLGAALLRLADIGTWSFWVDEAHTFRDATMPLDGEGGFWEQDRAKYPLTFLLVRLLLDTQLVSTGEGAIRLPFALAGIATVPVLWATGRALVGERAALLAAVFLAVMPWHVFWSQSARGYVFVVPVAAIATALVWRFHERDRLLDLVLAIAVVGLGTLFHSTTATMGLGLLVFLFLRRRELTSRGALAFGIATAILLAALPIVIRELEPFPEFQRAKGKPALGHFLTTTGYYFRPLLLVAALGGLVLMRRQRSRAQAVLFAALAATPFLVLAVVGGSIVQTTARYALSALPVVLWLGAYAAVNVYDLIVARGAGRALRVAGAALGVALGTDLAIGSVQYFAHHHGDRARWREACRFLDRRSADRHLLVVTPMEPIVRYYLTRDYWQNGGMSDPSRQVRVLENWLLTGVTKKVRVHDPGAAAHLRWQVREAARLEAQLAVALTRPLAAAKDPSGELWRTLQDEFELLLYLPCWVGPKDESIYVFVPAVD